MDTLLYICLAVCATSVLALALYIFFAVRKRSYISAIYSSSVRDCRFAYALLKLFFGSYVIRSPYLIRNPEGISPKADVVAVLRGGIVIITVLDKKGFYLTPPDKDWTLTTESGIERFPNAHKVAAIYQEAINEALIKAGIPSQTITSAVLLSDDKAKFDELYPEGILTSDMLIPFCKELCKTSVMPSKTRKQVLQALTKHHKSCRTYIEKNLYKTGVSPEAESKSPVEEKTPQETL